MRKQFPPGSYAVVMATGIVSVAAASAGRPLLSDALFAVGAAVYVLLPFRVRPERGFSLFAFTAAGDVLATRAAAEGWEAVALGVWVLDLAAWLAFVVWLARRPPRRRDARGEWLLVVVATESLALVAGVLDERGALPAARLVAVAFFALGLALYPVVLVLLAPRVRVLARGEEPPAGDDWILLGALAISALTAEHVDVNHALALGLWVAALLWLPALVAAELRAFPPTYDMRRWSAVFPLGMLAASSYAVGMAAFGAVAAWTAFAAWLATALGAVASVRETRLPRIVRRKSSA
jgi:tellurite resistance protein TehA-like permease